jgi:hypothetical protein
VCGETAAAALTFVADCTALIIDLRDNGGGDPAMVGFLSSYLFDAPVHLNAMYARRTDAMAGRRRSYQDESSLEAGVYPDLAAHVFCC